MQISIREQELILMQNTCNASKTIKDGKITDGVLADANNKYWLDGYAGGNANTDWYDVIYREWTSSQEHNLSFSGGNDKVNYYISGNFMDQKGLMEFNQDTYKRYTGTGKSMHN